MRKTFKLFCAAALAALAVSSCGKIWDEFDSVHGELDDLKAKVEALEEKLNSEVATLNTKLGALEQADKDLKALITANSDALAALNEELDALDGVVDGYITSNDAALKAAIEDYKKADAALKDVDTEILAALAGVNVINVAKNEDGNVVITFADKSTIEVPANPATGIVTVVDGKWAVVVDGKVTELDALVHPDTTIDFKVDENNELLVSYDGKKSWEKTGVVVNDETTFNVVEAFEYEEGDPYVTLTVGGVDYVLPVYKADTSSLVLGRTDFFLMYGASKEVELKAEGIDEYYVMSKPDGWKASFEGSTLTVVAPEKKTYEVGAAEAEGEILIHATTAEGKCKVAKLDVKTGLGLTVEVDINGNLVVTNSYASEQTSMATGEKFYNFNDFYIGFASDIASFEDDPTAYFDYYKNNWDFPNGDMSAMFYNNYNLEFNEYVEVEYETDVVTTTVTDIYSWLDWMGDGELPYGQETLLWVVPADADGMPISEAAQYVKYTRFDLDVEISGITHNDADMTMTLKGATKFFIGLSPVYPNVPMETVFSEAGLWMYLQMPEYLEYYEGYSVEDVENQKIKLSDLYDGEPLAFNTKYYVYVFPYVEGTAYTDFKTQFAPYVMEITTNDLQAGGAYKVSFGEEEVGYDYISVPITIAEGTESVYYAWYAPEDYAEFENDADVRAALFEDCYMPLSVYEEEISENNLNPGESWVLATVSVGTDGKYGEVVSKTYKTLAVPYDENISATLESLTLVDGKYTAVFSVKGAKKVVGNNMSTIYNEDGTIDEESEAGNLAYAVKNIVSKPGVYYSYQWVDVVDGKATVTFNSNTYKKDYYVWGYNVDEDGAVIGLQATPLVFNLAKNLLAAE